MIYIRMVNAGLMDRLDALPMDEMFAPFCEVHETECQSVAAAAYAYSKFIPNSGYGTRGTLGPIFGPTFNFASRLQQHFMGRFKLRVGKGL
jgi:hypothetical protein